MHTIQMASRPHACCLPRKLSLMPELSDEEPDALAEEATTCAYTHPPNDPWRLPPPCDRVLRHTSSCTSAPYPGTRLARASFRTSLIEAKSALTLSLQA